MFLTAIPIDVIPEIIRAVTAEPAASTDDEVKRFPVASFAVEAAMALSAARALKIALFTSIELLIAKPMGA